MTLNIQDTPAMRTLILAAALLLPVAAQAQMPVWLSSRDGVPYTADNPLPVTMVQGGAAAITSGTIDGATIGGTTPAPGTFTTLSTPSATISGGTISGVTLTPNSVASSGVNHGQYTWSNYTAVAGAGTTLATATTIASGTVKITACAAGAGVKLPALPSGTLGFSVSVLNRSGATCLLYPSSATVTIEGGTGGAPVTLASGGNYEFVGDSTTDWLQVSR